MGTTGAKTEDDKDDKKCVLCRAAGISNVHAGSPECRENMPPPMRSLFDRTKARIVAEGLRRDTAGVTRSLTICREEMGLE